MATSSRGFIMNIVTITTSNNFVINGITYDANVTSEVIFIESGIGNKIFSIECQTATDSNGNPIEDFEEQSADFYDKIEEKVKEVFFDEHDYCTKPDDDFLECSYEDWRIK